MTQLAFDLHLLPPHQTEQVRAPGLVTDDRAVAFTGTQRGMTDEQQASTRRLLFLFEWSRLHHGDCIGADAQVHDLALERGLKTAIHPPDVDTKRAWKFSEDIRPPRPYLVRNHDMVDACWFLIATPGEPEEQQRSGTWSTVRYARTIRRCIWVVRPSGEVIGPQP